MTPYYVEVVRISTGEVTASHGPMHEHDAELLEAEIEADLDWEQYFTVVMPEEVIESADLPDNKLKEILFKLRCRDNEIIHKIYRWNDIFEDWMDGNVAVIEVSLRKHLIAFAEIPGGA